MESSKRIFLAFTLSALILIAFNLFVPKPVHHPVSDSGSHAARPTKLVTRQPKIQPAAEASGGEISVQSGDNVGAAPRLQIQGSDVQGSFNLRGARLDDLVLNRYRETLEKDSPLVRLLDRAGSDKSNSVVIGWQNTSGFTTRLPDAQTLWKSSAESLTSHDQVVLSWDNGAGVLFLIHLKLDDHYVFTVTQEVQNHSGQPVSVHPFLAIQRDYLPEDTGSMTEFEGLISVMGGRLTEKSYKALRKGGEAAEHPDHIVWQTKGSGGWGGISDKYWLTAIGANPHNMVTARYAYLPDENSYQVSFCTAEPQLVQPGAALSVMNHIFVGAKVPSLLQFYSRTLGLTDFDKAIDFGYFSLLTRPILYVLHWLYIHIGNFGLALMALTLIVKILLFPLASKAAVSAARMSLVAPKMQELRERYKDEPMVLNQKIMALYKEEKINPAGGCLPILIQAPIFFCLYKMLNLSIDERHAPFFGWIRDLSVPDPTNLFNLFGLLPFEPTHIFSFLHLSIWGTALGFTFWILQRQSMASMDPAQARIMQFMPLFYMFIMSSFPAGLLVYYTWNNILTFLQQTYIQRRTTLPVPIKR